VAIDAGQRGSLAYGLFIVCVNAALLPCRLAWRGPRTPIGCFRSGILCMARAESWGQKGEEHRALAFRLAHDALKKLSKKRVPPPADWQEIEKADKMARRAAGMDDGERLR
jgi:hypothetical protein